MSSIPNVNIGADSALIDSHGGPAKLAKLLGLRGYAVQRIHNWRSRGIPAAIKVAYPRMFMPELAPALANTAQQATETVANQGV